MSDHTADPIHARQVHPMLHVGKWVLADLLSTLFFVGLYAAFHNIYLATGLGIAIGLGQIAYLRMRGAPIDLMQWLSLFLVVVFGGVTLLTHDPVFIMLKPTVIYIAVGAVMLRPGWMNRYAPPVARDRGADLLTTFGYIWAALMFVTGLANLALALLADPVVWAWFVGTFPLASKIVLIAVQYAILRHILRRRIRAIPEPA